MWENKSASEAAAERCKSEAEGSVSNLRCQWSWDQLVAVGRAVSPCSGCQSVQGKLCRDVCVSLVAEVWEGGFQCWVVLHLGRTTSHKRDRALVAWGWRCTPGLEQSIPVPPKGLHGRRWPSAVHGSAALVPGGGCGALSGTPAALAARLVPAPRCIPPASGEERSERAAFRSLKVIWQLQREEKRSAARALGRGGGRTEWQAARTAMLISAATRCLKNRALCFALGFVLLPLRFS